MRGEGAWTLFELIEFMGFVELTGLNSLDALMLVLKDVGWENIKAEIMQLKPEMQTTGAKV